ncbi:MAG TPA: hypothetical protein VFQ24_08200 [Terriglobia bacterium]|nr:hypothetical protein [Terriglobia bacterium]
MGVYVIARTHRLDTGCRPCELALRRPIPAYLEIDRDYELKRWLRYEPIIYIGKTNQPVSNRIRQFYRHRCGARSPHAGGQILLLLDCERWVYWSRSPNPRESEKKMLQAFKEQAGQRPYANFDGNRRQARIKHL